jgi:hypothetical protein
MMTSTSTTAREIQIEMDVICYMDFRPKLVSLFL